MKNYIFGYGSLLETESRKRTNPLVDKVYPLKIHGFLRGWFARTGVEGLTTTFLGCIKANKDSFVNGIIYEVSQEELNELDKREKGYKRILVPNEAIEDYFSILNSTDNVFIYSNVFPNNKIPDNSLPAKDYPIVQSYVDMCIQGCIEIESVHNNPLIKNFTKDFIQSTKYWSKWWVNDRIFPRRPFIYRPDAYKIDELLKLYLDNKNLFNSIYFE
ncbi:gamma-glutamylcyclotransferase family protein [Cyclobacterium xiamenense]|uniref:gamma-glutamylcyclotransferase family protein n=1 Tax=Cyclobacterium xiamenense TaxID=1297121 RepID=UPI0012B7E0B5|nr:gamma-glutamylcyclotransferase family protein [Cyclobacterium xiamenense]